MPRSDMDRVVVTMRETAASVRLPDGTCVVMPLSTVTRSSVLRQAIASANEEEQVSLMVPSGVLSSWIDGVHLLNTCSAGDKLCSAVANDKRLLSFLKAADFLHDQEAFKHLCHQASLWLFDTTSRKRQRVDEATTISSCRISRDRIQGMKELPTNLQQAILSASSTPLTQQLDRLPRLFHSVALHASFPSIAAERSLAIDYDAICDKCREVLWPALSDITSLHLSQVIGGRMVTVAEHLGSLTQLMDLSLPASYFLERGASLLGPQLSRLSNLQRLDLSNSYLYIEAIRTLLPHVSGLNLLRELNISGCFTYPQSVIVLEPVLPRLVLLRQLNLSYNCLWVPGRGSLVSVLAKLTCLQHLDLSGCMIGDDVYSYRVLGYHLAELKSLQHLDLSYTDIGEQGIKWLAPFLAVMSSLQHLNLSCCEMGQAGLKTLGPCLGRLRSLQHLNLSRLSCDSVCSQECASALGPQLATLKCLKHLDLSWNLIGDEGIKVLGPYLAVLTALKELHLHRCAISVEGAKNLTSKLASSIV